MPHTRIPAQLLLPTIALALLVPPPPPRPAKPATNRQSWHLPLQSSQVIFDCRIGYRTFGPLNPDKFNAIFIPVRSTPIPTTSSL